MRSPEQIRPFPKALSRKSTTNRRQRKSRILTKTPIKAALDAELMARAQKKSSKSKPDRAKVQPKSNEAGTGSDRPVQMAKRKSETSSMASSSKKFKIAEVMKLLF
jgi:hypothetical protein